MKTNSSNVPFSRVGVLGLGIMGSAMAGNLIKSGFKVFGFDPRAAARHRLKSLGGSPCRDVGSLARQVEVVICSLPSAESLRDCAERLAGAARPGTPVIETSTLDLDDKRAAKKTLEGGGMTLLDCPLSGTGAQALRKDLAVYASGPRRLIKNLAPVFDGFSRVHYFLGDFGNGMRMKLMANLLVAIHNVSTAEALLLGSRWGIKPKDAVRILGDGAGASRMLEVRGPVMAEGRWSEAAMKVSVWQKDMRLIAQALAEAKVPAPLFSATIPIYNAAVGAGHGDHDTAAVFEVLSRMSSPFKAH